MRRGIAASVALVSVGMFGLAACGGGTTGIPASQSSPTSTASSGGSGQGQSGSGGSNGSGGSSSSGGSNSGSGSNNSSSGGSNGSNANSPNAKIKPTFTSAAVSPGLVTCAKLGDLKDVTVSWTTKNATQVEVRTPGDTFPLIPGGASGSVARTGACKGGALTWNLTATGPGGSTMMSASANYTVVTPPAAPGVGGTPGFAPGGSGGSGGSTGSGAGSTSSGAGSTSSGGGPKTPSGQ
jgi:hypothetical protein